MILQGIHRLMMLPPLRRRPQIGILPDGFKRQMLRGSQIESHPEGSTFLVHGCGRCGTQPPEDVRKVDTTGAIKLHA